MKALKIILHFIAVISIILLINSSECPSRHYDRNERLSTFREAEGDHMWLYSPVYSKSGNTVYFLKSLYQGEGGSIWCGYVLTNEDRLVNSEKFRCLALSSTDTLIAAILGNIYEVGDLVLLDTLGNILDTILDTLGVLDAEWSKKDTSLIYLIAKKDTSYGYYRININNRQVEFIRAATNYSFCLTSDDSIYDGKLSPQSSPMNPNLLVYVTGEGNQEDLSIFDISTGKDSLLNARPYKFSSISHPYWAPDGKSIIFTAGRQIGGPDFSYRIYAGDLWKIDISQP
jgi:hypothetical protein